MRKVERREESFMALHHFAIATKNFEMAHFFYTEVMKFPLVAGVKRQAPGGGWTKHMFYDIGDGETMALWDLRGIEGVQLTPDAWRSAISTGLGLPRWMNHFAFTCKGGEEELEQRKQNWLDAGYHVSLVDHEFIRSIYTFDPDGNWVEWTYNTRPIGESDTKYAHQIHADDTPATEADYDGPFFRSTVGKYRPAPKPLPVMAE
jgi:catechol 2,3-dioxygenase-like lactoylglutathione lyase family enzyme